MFTQFVFSWLCIIACVYLFFMACVVRQAVRWETLRLDAPSGDEVWNGLVGFRRALADPSCFVEFRKLLR